MVVFHINIKQFIISELMRGKPHKWFLYGLLPILRSCMCNLWEPIVCHIRSTIICNIRAEPVNQTTCWGKNSKTPGTVICEDLHSPCIKWWEMGHIVCQIKKTGDDITIFHYSCCFNQLYLVLLEISQTKVDWSEIVNDKDQWTLQYILHIFHEEIYMIFSFCLRFWCSNWSCVMKTNYVR